jgi:hypothetical protein
MNQTEIIVSRFHSSFNARIAESNDTAKIFPEEIAAADEPFNRHRAEYAA